MDQVRALIGIYVAIDRAVRDDPQLATRVWLPLPVYGQGEINGEAVPGWSESFEQWARERAAEEEGDPAAAIPSLEESLDGLAEVDPECRMRARRLLAVAAAARIFFALNPDLLQAAALGPEHVAGLDDSSGKILVDLLRRTPQTSDPAAARDLWWSTFTSGQVPALEGVGPPPCSARLVWVDDGGNPEPAVAVTTDFDTRLPFDQVKTFATDPESWECFPCWCDMDHVQAQPDGAQLYREIVSFDCEDGNILRLVINLDFRMDERADRVITRYDMSSSQPPGQQLVRVNKGSLVVRQLGPERGSLVNVKTTKRLRFDPPLDSPGFLSILCYLGYLTFVEDLLCCAAKGVGVAAAEHLADRFPGIPPREGDAAEPRVGTTA